MSKSLWVPFLWVVIIASRPVGYWLRSGDDAADDVSGDVGQGSFIDRNTYLILILVGLGLLLWSRFRVGEFIARNRLMCFFYLYLLASILWSENPFIAFKRWFKDTGNLVMVLLIWGESDPVEAICSVLVRAAYVLVPTSVLFIKYFPLLGRYTHRYTYETFFSGVTTNKNTLGLLAMISGLVILWKIVDAPRHRLKRFTLTGGWPDLAIVAMCIWLLYKAHSSTSIFCFILGTIVFLVARLRWIRTHVNNLRWAGLALALVMVAFTISEEFRGGIAAMLGRDVTLTDRTLIWEGLLKLPTNPLIGCGFDSFWLTQMGADYGEEWHIPHAHNAYLEMYLQTGWIGVCLLLAVLIRIGRNAGREMSSNTSLGNFYLAFTLVGLIYNYTEVAFFRENALETVLWILAVSYGRSAATRNDGTVPGESQAESELDYALPEGAS